jgi:hypothetical protein
VPHYGILREDSGLEERLHQTQDTLVPDSFLQPVNEAGMRNFVEARRDVGLQHPLIGMCAEEVDLGYCVLGAAPGAEAVAARLEVRFQYRLEHQFQRSLDHPVSGGRDAEATKFSVCLGYHPLPHRQRPERKGLEFCSQPDQQRLGTEHDGARLHPIDAGRSCSPVAPDPRPRNHEEGGVTHEVVQVLKATTGVVARPSVQLGLDLQYP